MESLKFTYTVLNSNSPITYLLLYRSRIYLASLSKHILPPENIDAEPPRDGGGGGSVVHVYPTEVQIADCSNCKMSGTTCNDLFQPSYFGSQTPLALL